MRLLSSINIFAVIASEYYVTNGSNFRSLTMLLLLFMVPSLRTLRLTWGIPVFHLH